MSSTKRKATKATKTATTTTKDNNDRDRSSSSVVLLMDTDEIDILFQWAAYICITVHILLHIIILIVFCPPSNNNNNNNNNPSLHNIADSQEQEQEEEEWWAYLPPAEQQAALIAFYVLLIATILMGCSLQMRSNTSRHHHPSPSYSYSSTSSSSSSSSSVSGIIIAALVVQCISMCTNALLAFGPTIVVIDPITHARVFLHRWCEWIPLSALMTFLSEAIDIPKPKPNKPKSPPQATSADDGDSQSENQNQSLLYTIRWQLIGSLSQGLSCLCGIVFPFCNFHMWIIMMFISCITYFTMFPRLYMKHCEFSSIARGVTTLDKEYYDRKRFSRNLFAICTAVWSSLVIAYFINMMIHRLLPHDSPWRFQSLAMLVDTIFDVIAKVLYMGVIVEVHILVFDSQLRAQRQLSELRRLMTVLWDNGTDPIVISIRHQRGGRYMTSIFSPAFIKFIGASVPDEITNGSSSVALLLETTSHTTTLDDSINRINRRTCQNTKSTVIRGSYIDSSELPYRDTSEIRSMFSPDSDLAKAAVNVLDASWLHCPPPPPSSSSPRDDDDGNRPRSILFVHPQQRIMDGIVCQCEIQVSQHIENAIVVVIRDVTERYKRFEAERRAHTETIARQRDAQAINRFTRHEVKNGLLAGIELCNSLRTTLEEDTITTTTATTSELNSAQHDDNTSTTKTRITKRQQQQQQSIGSMHMPRRYIRELDETLHEILDIVLAEAMARDVIHGVYHPKVERLDVMALLSSNAMSAGEGRFILETTRNDLPFIILDPQLLRHIHRNAISNACKYGRQGGKILTRLSFTDVTKKFEMNIINEPGVGHEELMSMGSAACDAVFAQGSRLHAHFDNDDNRRNYGHISSGDGAWIMEKCAKTMGGSCTIRFEEHRVVLTFQCEADYVSKASVPNTPTFQVPPLTWGIGLDDSKMQRRLIGRILTSAGVEDSKRVVLGGNPADVEKLSSIMSNILNESSGCKILLIIDENLDYVNDDPSSGNLLLSGSLATKNVLDKLPRHQQEQCLAVVRSANDSAEDVALYLERLHGFFPKAPMKPERVCEILAPIWLDRFTPREQEDPLRDDTGSKVDDEIVREDILDLLERVEDLLLANSVTDDIYTQKIWPALHTLRGDLMVVDGVQGLDDACVLIGNLKGCVVPDNFTEKWRIIRQMILESTATSLG